METVYIAGGCLWGVQHFFDTVPGVRTTEAGRANGTTNTLDGPYDGYAECVKVVFDEKCISVTELMEHQHHLERYPEDCSYCHIPDEVLNKYRNQ